MDKPRSALFEISIIMATIVLLSIWVWDHTSFPGDSDVEMTGAVQIDSDARPAPADTVMTHSERIDRVQAARWREGKSLFKSNCAACHNIRVAQTGPALWGIEQRWHEAGQYKGKPAEYWLYQAIRNWPAVVKAGYPRAVYLSKNWKGEMNLYPDMSDKDIREILDYINTSEAYQPIVYN